MGRAGRVEVGPPASWELAELKIQPLGIQSLHHMAHTAPAIQPLTKWGNLGWLLTELEEAEGCREQGAAVTHRRQCSVIDTSFR